MRYLSIPISEILSMVSCARDYGFEDDVLFDGLAGWVGRTVTDAEIEAYAGQYLTPERQAQGYSEEDYQGSKDRLTAWRDKYCKGAKA